jgi:APA family basic amino acid/polyamine antiporter
MKPAVMARQLGSPWLLMGVWLLAGLVSMIGALVNAEVGTRLPHTGGQYVYFKEMYGDFFAFIAGWASFIVINTASVAAIAYVFADYSGYFFHLPRLSHELETGVVWHLPYLGDVFPLENIGVKLLAIGIIVLITWVNHLSVSISSKFQVAFMVLKVGVLLLLSCWLLFSGKGSWQHFSAATLWPEKSGWQLAAAIAAATSGALAAFDGWNNLGMVAGEIKNPQRSITRGLIMGLGVCIAVYFLVNLAYLYMLDIHEMSLSELVASDSLERAIGYGGGAIIALLVMLSTLGALNANLMPCARVSFAMGRQGHFFKWVGQVHPKWQTPSNALWLHAAWCSLFIMTGSFDMLTDLFVFTTWIFYGFAGFGIFVLRKKQGAGFTGFKMPGYPVLPLVFVVFALFYFCMTIYSDISAYAHGSSHTVNSLLGLSLLLLGVPFYFVFKRNLKS